MKKLLFLLVLAVAVATSGCAAIPGLLLQAGYVAATFPSGDGDNLGKELDRLTIGQYAIVVEEKNDEYKSILFSVFQDGEPKKGLLLRRNDDETKEMLKTFFSATEDEKKELLQTWFLQYVKFDLLTPAPLVADKAEPPAPQAETLSFRKFSGEIPPTAGFH